MPEIASTTAGLALLMAKKIRKDPTPATNRLIKYHSLLRGDACSDCRKICSRHEGRIRNNSAPRNVPVVKMTYPLTKLVRSNAIFCNTEDNPKVPAAATVSGRTRLRLTASARNMKNPPATINPNPATLDLPSGCRSKGIPIRYVNRGENPPMMARVWDASPHLRAV